MLIGKLRPNKISIDKERLYIENMELKVKNNDLAEHLTKYKAKILQLEREKIKKEDSPISNQNSHSNYLVKLLKKNIKDLKVEVSLKDEEILKHKKNIKLTKIFEIELEMKAYIDECTRLRHHLEESLKQKAESEYMSNSDFSSDTKSINLFKIIEDNQKEILKLKEKVRFDSEISENIPKMKEEISRFIKEIQKLKDDHAENVKKLVLEIENLKKDLKIEQNRSAANSFKLQNANSLIENLYKELKSIRQKKYSLMEPPKCLQIINHIISLFNSSISEYFKSISSNSKKIETSKLLFILRQHDNSITNKDLEPILIYIKGKSPSEISIKKFINYYNTFVFSDEYKESNVLLVKDLFRHLSLRMQLHRVPKENLLEALVGAGSSELKTITQNEILGLFTNSPFNFSKKQAGCITEYLFNYSTSLEFSKFVENFYKEIHD